MMTPMFSLNYDFQDFSTLLLLKRMEFEFNFLKKARFLEGSYKRVRQLGSGRFDIFEILGHNITFQLLNTAEPVFDNFLEIFDFFGPDPEVFRRVFEKPIISGKKTKTAKTALQCYVVWNVIL